MGQYLEIQIPVTDTSQKEILIAQLSVLGIEGFEEERNLLKAFIPSENFNQKELDEIMGQNNLQYSKSIIEDRNWNEEWEANFQPVAAGNFCAIRADFHNPVQGVKHDIIITPKMSFGTGHHASTFMMIEAMALLNFTGKAVFDYGTGTGVLAILAEKCGAAFITAIDNDDWSIENARENFNRNNCFKVLLIKEEKIVSAVAFDVILANINRNIILQNLGNIKQHLAVSGVLLVSGLLAGDQPVILAEAQKNGLLMNQRWERNGWICLQLIPA